jgi:phosphate transport system substrate-binding protein
MTQWLGAGSPPLGNSVSYSEDGAEGRRFYAQGGPNFTVSEIPLPPTELQAMTSAGRSPVYVPIAAGAIGIGYKLVNTSSQPISLRLSAATLTKLLTAGILTWDDPAVLADNPQVPTCAVDPLHCIHTGLPVNEVVRGDSNPMEYLLTSYMQTLDSADWTTFTTRSQVPNAPTELWPQHYRLWDQSPAGDDTVAFDIAHAAGNGFIGVGSVPYLLAHGVAIAAIQNKAGNFVVPTAASITAALSGDQLNADHTVALNFNAPDPQAYPLASVSYLIADGQVGADPTKGAAIGALAHYAISSAGQQTATQVGDGLLPAALVAAATAALTQIPGAPGNVPPTTTTIAPTTTTAPATTTTTAPSPSTTTTTRAPTGSSQTGARVLASTQNRGDTLPATGAGQWRWLILIGVAMVLVGQASRIVLQRGRR